MNTLELKTRAEPRRPISDHLKKVWLTLRPFALPVLVVGTLVFSVISGFVAIKLPPRLTQLALAGLILFFVTLVGLEYVLLLVLAMSSTLIQFHTLPSLFGFSAVELCVMFLLGLVVARAFLNKGEGAFVRTPLDWPVFLFFIMSTVSMLNAIYIQETAHVIRTYVWRVLMLYLLFFAVTNLIRSRRQLMTLIGGLFVMATIVAFLMVAQQAVGPSVSIIPGQNVSTATVLGQSLGGVARVSPSAAFIVYVMLLPAYILYVTTEYQGARKWLMFFPIVLLPLAIAFTFDRNMWIGIMLGAVAFVLISRFKGRRFILLVLTLIIAAILLASLLNVYFPRIDTIADGLLARFNSLFAGDQLINDPSTQWRLRENEFAIAKIKEYPILGVGPGAEYRVRWSSTDSLTRYMHNTFLYLLVDLGILGFLPFLWFSLAFLVRGFTAWYTLRDRVLRALVVGFTVSYIAALASNIASPWFITIYGAPLVAVMLGINEVAIRLGQSSAPPEAST